jgi:hypothetical protein
MDQILQSLRTLLIDHLAASETLTADLALGGTSVKVPNTSRFRISDQIYVMSNTVGFGETAFIQDIPDDKTITINPGTVRGWLVSEDAFVQKAVNNQFIKRILIGDIKQIPSFPTITITGTQESNEWVTLRQTSHDYRFAIRIYVMADGFETTNLFLIKLAKQTREILLDHIRPIINGESHPLTLDLPANATVVTIADTSNFTVGSPVFIRDAHPRPAHQESYIQTVLSPTEVEIAIPSAYEYLVSRSAEMILVERLMYDSRCDSINLGYVSSAGGGPMMAAAELSYYCKEFILRQGNLLT